MASKNIQLSVALAVYNEANNLGDCLSSIQSLADEIVVVDGTSTDNTAKIARQHGAKVITEPNRTNFHINKQIAIDACQGAWILQLDADERVSPELVKDIRNVVQSPKDHQPAAFYLNRRNYFLGRAMRKGGMYPDRVIRLFQRGRAQLPQRTVHELMTVDGELATLQHDLDHHADPTFSRYLKRSNRYTSLQAEEWLEKGNLGTGVWAILSYFFFKPLYRFLEIYLRHKGFMDGFPGFVFAVYSGLHLTTSYVKYWEKRQLGSKITIQQDWN